MAASDLEVTIGADARQYTTTMQQAAATAVRTSRALEQVPRGVNAASNSLQSFARVIQDLPYGIQGIGNNITEIQPIFRRLVQETGSTGAAFRALAGALIGSGGIGLAISAVTTAFTFASIGLQAWGRRNTEAKKTVDAHAESVKSLVSESAKELVTLDVLYDATQNTTLSLGERKAAVDELQRQYPAYFANLKDEAILAGKAAGAYDNLANSIINQAIIKAAESDLQETIKPYIELITAQRKLQADVNRQNAANQAKNPARVQEFKTLDKNFNEVPGYTEVVPTGATMRTINNDFMQLEDGTLKGITNYKNGTLEAIKEARGAIQQAISDFGINALFEPAKPEKAKKAGKRLFTDLGEAGGVPVVDQGISRQTGLFGAGDGNDRILQFQKEANAQIELARASELANAAYSKQEKLVGQLSSTFGQGLTNTFESIISGSQSAIQAIGGFLTSLVARLIAAAAAAALLAVILSAVGFGGGLSGAASSAGSFKNLFNGLSGFTAFAEGGIVSGPTRALIGEGGEPEAVMPLSKLSKFVNNTGGGRIQIEPVLLPNGILLKSIERGRKEKSRIS